MNEPWYMYEENNKTTLVFLFYKELRTWGMLYEIPKPKSVIVQRDINHAYKISEARLIKYLRDDKK